MLHSDLEANIPDDGLPLLVSRAKSVDARGEGSRYPNLMIPEVGQRYGIS